MKERKTILVVDDEASMRTNVVELLSREGYSVYEAVDGAEALKAVKSHPLNLVLLDINLPKIDGITALKEIKKDFVDLPVIVFTAYGTSERAIEAMKAGAYDYLDKPFELDEFLLVVRRALTFGDLLGEVKQLRSTVSINTQLSATSQLVGISQKSQEIHNFSAPDHFKRLRHSLLMSPPVRYHDCDAGKRDMQTGGCNLE